MVLRNNRKALNQVDVLHRTSVFKVGFVSYPSVMAIRLLQSQKKSKAERVFRMFCKTKKNPWGLVDGGVQLLLYCSHRSNTSKKVQPSPKEQATETFCSKDTNQKLRGQDLAAADFWETGKHPSGYTSFPEQSLIWHSQGCRTKRSLNRGLFLRRLCAAGLNMTCSNCHGWHEAAPWPLSTAAMKLAQLGNLKA